MAGKRPHDVISIDSDSEEEALSIARPPKIRRRNEAHFHFPERSYYAEYHQTHAPLAEEPSPDDMAIRESVKKLFKRKSNASKQSGRPVISLPSSPVHVTHGPTLLQDLFDRVLEIVPDVAHDHVSTLITTHGADLERIVEQLFSATYPKEVEQRAAREAAEQAALREKELAEAAELEKLVNPGFKVTSRARKAIMDVLKTEFINIPVKYIREVQRENKYLYPSYIALNEAQHADECPYGRCGWRPVNELVFELYHGEFGKDLDVNLLEQHYHAAQKAARAANAQRRKEEAEKRRVQERLEQAKASGRAAQCCVCYDDTTLDEVVHCDAATTHSTCFGCMRTYMEVELGQSSSKLICPAGCAGTFLEVQLRHVPDSTVLVDGLMRLRMEKELESAGIQDIEGCPFCDFKTVVPPVDVDFEFRCLNPACTVVSCRKCKHRSHIPDSCEENERKRSKDTAVSLRHKIEEEMSKALIRSCNKCKRPFIKEHGCNKMTCPNCGNLQCYICGVDVAANYKHFQPPSKCPTFDEEVSLADRHAQEVKAAEEAAQAAVLRDNPDVDKDHLAFKLSASVVDAENPRPLQMHNDHWQPAFYQADAANDLNNADFRNLLDRANLVAGERRAELNRVLQRGDEARARRGRNIPPPRLDDAMRRLNHAAIQRNAGYQFAGVHWDAPNAVLGPFADMDPLGGPAPNNAQDYNLQQAFYRGALPDFGGMYGAGAQLNNQVGNAQPRPNYANLMPLPEPLIGFDPGHAAVLPFGPDHPQAQFQEQQDVAGWRLGNLPNFDFA